MRKLTKEVEERVGEVAGQKRKAIIAELFPNADPEKLDRAFYHQLIQPLTVQYFEEGLAQYFDFVHLAPDILDDDYLRLNSVVSQEVFIGIHSLGAPSIRPLSSDPSDGLEDLIRLYESRGLDWIARVRQWVKNLTDQDLDIWEMSLRNEDASSIRQKLRLPGGNVEVTERIHFLQRQLLIHLISGFSS